MNAEDRAGELCARAELTEDLDELDEILVELRALIRDYFAHVSEVIQERRRRADLENQLGKSA